MLCSLDGDLSELSAQCSAVQCRLISQTKIGVETCGCILSILHTERSVHSRYRKRIQLGQLRLNPPGLGSKCGKRVERLSDF